MPRCVAVVPGESCPTSGRSLFQWQSRDEGTNICRWLQAQDIWCQHHCGWVGLNPCGFTGPIRVPGPPPWGRWAHSEGPQAVPFLWPFPPKDAVAGVGMSPQHRLYWLGTTQILWGFGGQEGQMYALPFLKLVSHNFIRACSRKCL